MKTKPHYFAVRGVGPLPFDMLRYDGCYPAREVDAHAAMREGERVTILLRTDRNTSRVPTTPRWKSFRWDVRVDKFTEEYEGGNFVDEENKATSEGHPPNTDTPCNEGLGSVFACPRHNVHHPRR